MIKTLFCAIAFTSSSIRALLTEDGKVVDRFFSAAPKTYALEEFWSFLRDNILKGDRLNYVVCTGYGSGHTWTELKTFLEKRSDSVSLDILKGPDVQQILTMDSWFQEYATFRKLELLAYLYARFRGQNPGPPEQIHLEWVINKTRDQLIYVQQKLRGERNAEQFAKGYSFNKLL